MSQFKPRASFHPDRWWDTRGGIRTEIIELRKLLLDLVLHPMSFWRRWLRESNGDGGQRALGVPLPVGQGASDPADGLEPVSASLRRPARRCLSTSCRAPENGLQPNVLGNRPSDADQRRGPLRASEVQGSSLDDGRFLRPTSAALSKVRAGRYQPERGGAAACAAVTTVLPPSTYGTVGKHRERRPLPQLEGDGERVHAYAGPPGRFVAIAMEVAMMDPADGDRVFVC